MTLSEKARSEIYTGLTPIVGEEATSQMLSCFPARAMDEPITREFLRAELLSQRLAISDEIGALRRDMQASQTALRQDVQASKTALRQDMRAADTALRQDLQAGDAALRLDLHTEIGALRREMRTMFCWMMGTMITLTGVLSGVFVAVR